jgi:hypothetical protein
MSDLAAERFYARAEHEGVHLLIADCLTRDQRIGNVSEALRARLIAALRDAAAIEQVVRRELGDVATALRRDGVDTLLFKGAALALTHYASPVLRPHVDIDVLLPADAVPEATAVFERLGYRRPPYVTGQLVSSQLPYQKLDRHGVRHAYDLHWKISIPQVFANTFSIDELAAGAIPVPRVDGIRAIGPLHALLAACIHRVAHHHGRDRLIWLYDIHLLGERLSVPEAEELVRLAAEKQITAVCERGIALAQKTFGTRCPARLLEGLRIAEGRSGGEPSAVYLQPRLRKVDVLRSDLAALPSWRARGRLLKEHVFPPAAYMREAYGVKSLAWMPALYAWRFARGARRWVLRPK